MKRALRALAIVVVLLAGAAVAVPALFPAESWKPAIQSRVKAALGRDLRIGGAMRLTLLPRVELQVDDVGLSNFAGSPVAEMVTLDRLRLVLKVMPLLSGRVVVDRFLLDRPVVSLEVNARGEANWKFAAAAAPGGAADGRAPGAVGAAAASATATEATAGGPMELHLDDVRLQEGVLRYADRRGGQALEARGVDVSLSLPGLDQPLRASGQLEWKKETVTFDTTVVNPRALFGQGDSGVQARVDTGSAYLSYDGRIHAGSTLRAAGVVDLHAASLRDLSAWLGYPLDAPPATLEALKVHGRVEASRESVSFTEATLSLDAIESSGRVSLSLVGPRPRVEAVLDLKDLDLRPWLPVAAPSADKGLKTRDGWSDEPVSVQALGLVDGSLQMTVASLVTPRVRTGNGTLLARLDAGTLAVDVQQLALHDGSARGALTLQAMDKGGVRVGCDLHLAGVQLEPLLRDAAGGDWLTGGANIDVALEGSGGSVRELVGSLDGKGAVDLRNGSIRGVNLAAMVLNVASAFQKKRDGDRTEFGEIRGTYRMARGVLANSDLTLQSELLQADGAGTVDFGRRTVDYRVSPRFVAPVVGQLTGGIVGLKVPVLVRGPWSDLHFAPDLVGLLKEGVQAPGALLKGAADFTKGLFGR